MPELDLESSLAKYLADDQLQQGRQAGPAIPSRPSRLYRVGQGAVIGANAADAASTLHGWGMGDGENNGLIGTSPAKLVLAKSLGSAGLLGLMHLVAGAGHPKIAGAMGLGMAAVPAAATVHNLRRPWAK